MPHSPSASKEGKRLELPDDGLRFVSKRSFRRFLAMLSSALGISIKIDGATSSQSRDGELNFKLTSGANDHAFSAPTQASSSSIIQDGSVNGNLVTGSPVNIGTSGTVQLYIQITVTLTISANGYVADEFATQTAWSYQTGGSVPACTSGYSYVPVATYVDGVKTVQHLTTNISLRPRDDGTGTSTPTAFYWRS